MLFYSFIIKTSLRGSSIPSHIKNYFKFEPQDRFFFLYSLFFLQQRLSPFPDIDCPCRPENGFAGNAHPQINLIFRSLSCHVYAPPVLQGEGLLHPLTSGINFLGETGDKNMKHWTTPCCYLFGVLLLGEKNKTRRNGFFRAMLEV